MAKRSRQTNGVAEQPHVLLVLTRPTGEVQVQAEVEADGELEYMLLTTLRALWQRQAIDAARRAAGALRPRVVAASAADLPDRPQ